VPDHNRIIARVAKKHLAPLGVVRKGRSRVWLDDQGWWVGVLEFQPFSGRKGTTLNAAAHWLWTVKDYLSFDESFDQSHRQGAFVEYTTPAAFEQAAEAFAAQAAERVREIRSKLTTVADALAHVVAAHPAVDPAAWGAFHLAVLTGLAGDLAEAHERFAAIVAADADHEYAWRQERCKNARELQALTVMGDGRDSFVREVTARIHAARAAQKLPAIDALPWEL